LQSPPVQRTVQPRGWHILITTVCLLLGTTILFLLSRFNYLLFHGMAELSSVTVAITIFSIGWHTRHINRNHSFTLLASAYLSIGLLDLLHTLSYKGMGVFPGTGTDVPTQFWIAARSLQAGAYLASGWLLGRNGPFKARNWMIGLSLAGLLLGLAVWPLDAFPACLTEAGLTPFKIGTEYLISAALAWSGWLYWRGRARLDPRLTFLMLASIALAVVSELTFTFYQDVYGLTNYFGHLFKIASVFLVYRALILGSLKTPYQTLFRELSQSHRDLDLELVQRRMIEQQLRAANWELDTFVHTIAHDLRSPLSVFISGTEMVRRQLRPHIPEDLDDMLLSIEQKGWQMAHMLEDLLNLACIGRMEQPPEKVIPSHIITRVTCDLEKQIHANGTQVITEPLPELEAHPTLIYQLFANLIGNAVRYAGGPNTPIIIGGQRTDRLVRFFVRDHGPGISEAEKDKLGVAFYRGENAGNHPGTGIGLTIVQKIARYYQGRFWITDTPGGGATFWVELHEPAPSPPSDSLCSSGN
jgi:signal transduction histidine kinase